MSTITAYQHAPTLPRSTTRVRIEGVACDALAVPYHGGRQAALVLAAGTGPVCIELAGTSSQRPVVHPLVLGIEAERGDAGTGTFRIQAQAPCRLMIEQPGAETVFLAIAAPLPGPTGEALRFAAGQVHEVGELEVEAGREVWIEGGAVLRGAIRARGPGCRVRGHGIIDGSCFDAATGHRRTLVMDGCHDGLVEGVSIIHPSSWCCVLGACDRAVVRDLRVIGDCVCSDGIDLCGCRDCLVEDCLLVCNDDCVAVKAVDIRAHEGSRAPETGNDWRRDIARIEVRGCVLVNGPAGNGVEIGGETACDSITDIRYHDLDICCVHGYGSPFSIRVCDRAHVQRVRYEGIRVEHYYDRLVNIRVLIDRYATDAERGHVSDVRFTDIDISQQPCNLGNSDALIGGFDDEHRVSGVRFENLVLGGRRVTNAHGIDLLTRAADDITFL